MMHETPLPAAVGANVMRWPLRSSEIIPDGVFTRREEGGGTGVPSGNPRSRRSDMLLGVLGGKEGKRDAHALLHRSGRGWCEQDADRLVCWRGWHRCRRASRNDPRAEHQEGGDDELNRTGHESFFLAE